MQIDKDKINQLRAYDIPALFGAILFTDMAALVAADDETKKLIANGRQAIVDVLKEGMDEVINFTIEILNEDIQ